MIYRSEVTNLDRLFENGTFSIDKWKYYIENVFSGLSEVVIEDASGYNFEKDIVPIINNVYDNKERINKLEIIFHDVLKDVDEIIKKKTGRNLECEIILYLGLGNGAGWVIEHCGKTLILLGIEKILKLNLDKYDEMKKLIFHELGHVYQSQYGTLNKQFDSKSLQMLWQLYMEGIAVYFEQSIMEGNTSNTQYLNFWKESLEKSLPQLKKDFRNDLDVLNDRFTQRYFGDWVFYNGYCDAGYFLGEKFVNYLCLKKEFNDILDLSIEEIKNEYNDFCNLKS